MKRAAFISTFILLSILIAAGQEHHPKFLLKFQVIDGVFYSNSSDPSSMAPFAEDLDDWGINKGGNISILMPISFINIGAGIGCSYKYFNTLDHDSYIPNIYLMFEVGNSKVRNPISGTLMLGATKNAITNNNVFYLGAGASFNFKEDFEKLNFSLNPYVEYFHDKQDYIYYDYRYPNDPPGPTEIPYTLYFNSFTFNLSFIIQLNFY